MLKVCVQTVYHSREHMHSNDYVIFNVIQQPPLPQQTFFQLLHIIDPRTVDPLLKNTPDAVVHRIIRIQIWRLIGWPHLWRDKLWRLCLQHGDSVTCTICRCQSCCKNVVIPENRADIRQKHTQLDQVV